MAIGHAGMAFGAQIVRYARSVAGERFGLRLVEDGPDAGLRTCREEVDEMTLETCTGVAW